MSRGRGHLLFLAFLVEGGMGVTALFLAEWLSLPVIAGLSWRSRDAVYGLAATLPWLALFVVLLRARWRPFVAIREVLDQYLGPLVARACMAELFVVSLLAGVGEELLFRGVLQAWLAPHLGTAGALAAASLAFGLFHPLTPLYVVLASVIGAYLGVLWILTESLVAPIICHTMYDFVALLLFVRDNSRTRKIQSDDTPASPLT